MLAPLKLTVDQIVAAVSMLTAEEMDQLKQQLPLLLALDDADDLGWLTLSESAFDFWNDPAEDIYNDFVPGAKQSNSATEP